MRTGQYEINKTVGSLDFSIRIKLNISMDPNYYPITAHPIPMVESLVSSHPHSQQAIDGIENAIKQLPSRFRSHIDRVEVIEIDYVPTSAIKGLAEFCACMALFDAFDYEPLNPVIYDFSKPDIHYPTVSWGRYECAFPIKNKGFNFTIGLEATTYDEAQLNHSVQTIFDEQDHELKSQIENGLSYAIKKLPDELQKRLTQIFVKYIAWIPDQTTPELIKYGSCIALWEALDFVPTEQPTFDFSTCKFIFP